MKIGQVSLSHFGLRPTTNSKKRLLIRIRNDALIKQLLKSRETIPVNNALSTNPKTRDQNKDWQTH